MNLDELRPCCWYTNNIVNLLYCFVLLNFSCHFREDETLFSFGVLEPFSRFREIKPWIVSTFLAKGFECFTWTISDVIASRHFSGKLSCICSFRESDDSVPLSRETFCDIKLPTHSIQIDLSRKHAITRYNGPNSVQEVCSEPTGIPECTVRVQA